MTTLPRLAVSVLDGLSDREFAFVVSLVRPTLTREQYREELATGRLDARGFLDNVAVMRAVAPRAWGLRVIR